MIEIKVYNWDDAPNIDFIKDIDRIAWWSENHIALKEEKLKEESKK